MERKAKSLRDVGRLSSNKTHSNHSRMAFKSWMKRMMTWIGQWKVKISVRLKAKTSRHLREYFDVNDLAIIYTLIINRLKKMMQTNLMDLAILGIEDESDHEKTQHQEQQKDDINDDKDLRYILKLKP